MEASARRKTSCCSSLIRGLLLYICILLARQVSAEGTFELRLHRFVNDEGFNQSGRCCSGELQSTSLCSKPCRTAFRACLTHYQVKVDPNHPKCTFGEIKTPVLGENTFAPQNTEYIKQNPLQFAFTFRWPRDFSLIVDVIHQEPYNSVSISGQAPSKMMISRLIKHDIINPIPWNGNTWTTPAPYQHLKSRLHYSYRVRCDQNQYGEGCSTYCQPRDDLFGHYSCNERGEKVCLPGWTGSSEENYCTEPICLKGCNAEHGSCSRPNECKCELGWEGQFCDVCIPLPGCIHGKCSRPFQCNCNPGWGGLYCNQDLNYCTHHLPCQNGAICTNTGQGSYTCSCKDGFTGRDCETELDECISSPCSNGTQCVDLINGYKCICPSGYYGANCDQAFSCSNAPCKNGGKCTQRVGGNQYVCDCKHGWTGTFCGQAAASCAQDPCQNGADCVDAEEGYKCYCPSGYGGIHCVKHVNGCSSNPCQNKGSCKSQPSGGYKCDCLPGFTGNECQFRACNKENCLKGGRCVRSKTGARCRCLPGYFGKDCGMKTNSCLDDNPCFNGATCTDHADGPRCECPSNTFGPRCLSTRGTSASQNFGASQWLAICLGSAILVLVLVFAGVCLLYHRKKQAKRHAGHSLGPACAGQTHLGKPSNFACAKDPAHLVLCESCIHEDCHKHKHTGTTRIVHKAKEHNLVQCRNNPARTCEQGRCDDRHVRPLSINIGDQPVITVRDLSPRASLIFKADVEITGGQVLQDVPALPLQTRSPQKRSDSSLPVNPSNRLPTYEEACEERRNLLGRG